MPVHQQLSGLKVITCPINAEHNAEHKSKKKTVPKPVNRTRPCLPNVLPFPPHLIQYSTKDPHSSIDPTVLPNRAIFQGQRKEFIPPPMA
jgi:hypothetical protein